MSSLFGMKRKTVAKQQKAQKGSRPDFPRLVRTSYTSRPVDIPDDFLTTAPHDARPITAREIDFSETPLPEYDGKYAVVIEDVLSPSECAQLVSLTEQSAAHEDPALSGWRPAMVNAGVGVEVMATDYRDSDRIIWDNAEIVRRLWDRCLQADGIRTVLETIEHQPHVQGKKAAERGERWKFTRLNERMRFLRYGKGQHFAPHCDGSFKNPASDKVERSHYTLHLYLNDADQARGSDEPFFTLPQDPKGDERLKGGATTFWSWNEKNRLDVDPLVGRVLIFQHSDLLHSGDYVTAGMKYTMRTDLMYELQPLDK